MFWKIILSGRENFSLAEQTHQEQSDLQVYGGWQF
jgi:hypothetical protein